MNKPSVIVLKSDKINLPEPGTPEYDRLMSDLGPAMEAYRGRGRSGLEAHLASSGLSKAEKAWLIELAIPVLDYYLMREAINTLMQETTP